MTGAIYFGVAAATALRIDSSIDGSVITARTTTRVIDRDGLQQSPIRMLSPSGLL